MHRNKSILALINSIVGATAIVIAIGALSSCKPAYDSRLIAVEDIMDEHPDSALHILENMNVPDISHKGDLHLYHLLMAQARYKNFIEDDNDSIASVAAEYFFHKGDKERAAKAFHVSGIISLNNNKLGDAAVSFSKGIDISRENNNFFWEAQCARGMFMLYEKLFDAKSQLKYAETAYNAFEKGGFEDWANWSKKEVASAYNNLNQYSKSLSILEDLIAKGRERSDILLLADCLHLMGLLNFNMAKYNESISYYIEAFKYNHNILTEADKRNISIALSFIDTDSISADKRLLSEIEEICKDNVSFVVMSNRENYEEAYKALYKYKELQDNALRQVSTNNVSNAISLYQDSRRKLEQHSRQKERLAFVIVTLLAIMMTFSSFLMLRLRIRKNELLKEKLLGRIDSLKHDLYLQIERNVDTTKTQVGGHDNSFLKKIKQQYAEINDLCDKYYQFQGTKSINQGINQKVQEIVNDLTNEDSLKEVENYVDNESNGIYSSFKKDFCNLSQENKRLFLYYLLGFSARSISILYAQKVEVIYNKKSRLKASIENSDCDNKQKYLSVLHRSK